MPAFLMIAHCEYHDRPHKESLSMLTCLLSQSMPMPFLQRKYLQTFT